MFQIEISIAPSDGPAFIAVFWRFCSERLSFQPEPGMDVNSASRGQREVRIITFSNYDDATAFRRQWALFEDARVDWAV